MTSLYWIEEALPGILPTLWMTLGIGLPWAYALVNTKQWHSRTMIVTVAIAVGPAWMTLWMLILGVIGAELNHRLFTPEWILSGSFIIAGIGIAIAWQKRKHFIKKPTQHTPFAFDEKLILGMIIIAVVIRWVHTAFWTFTAYDTLWVYGFQGRLYFLEGFIPHSIDYYPQFVQLQYTYIQVLIGEINDHAARMVIPMMHVGSILASYLLGERLFNRRVGLFVAAFWSLHPYVGQWSFVGDLEIPVTFSFTMASVFFLTAWMEKEDSQTRRNYALLAGLMLGIAMYTKPTAGAFIWGVMLVVAIELIRTRFQIRLWRPRFQVAFWAGLASIPLGAIWYLRNIALGHDAITFPPELWLSLARRSADHLNWLVLAILVGFIVHTLINRIPIQQLMLGILGIFVMLLGILPSNPIFSPERFDPPHSYITSVELLFILVGMSLVSVSVFPFIRQQVANRQSRTIEVIGWTLLLALPYFITWFYSYSYHYRLGFAIVPLLILPTAVFLSRYFTVARIKRWNRRLRAGYAIVLVILGIPGIISVAFDVTWSSIWLTDETLDSDIRKYQVFNPALMEIYFGINEYIAEHDTEPIIVAPGEQRLHFFFPQMQIIERPISTLEAFENYGATHFLYGTQAQWVYERNNVIPEEIQLITALGRETYFEETKFHSDATFRYELYERQDASRFEPAQRSDYPLVYDDRDIVFGDILRFQAVGISPELVYEGQNILLTSAWEALQPVHTDYQFVFEFYNPEQPDLSYQWFTQLASHRHGYYATDLWDIGETVHDEQFVQVAQKSKLELGKNYQFRVRVYDPIRNQFLPVFIDGQHVGDFFTMEGRFKFGNA